MWLLKFWSDPKQFRVWSHILCIMVYKVSDLQWPFYLMSFMLTIDKKNLNDIILNIYSLHFTQPIIQSIVPFEKDYFFLRLKIFHIQLKSKRIFCVYLDFIKFPIFLWKFWLCIISEKMLYFRYQRSKKMTSTPGVRQMLSSLPTSPAGLSPILQEEYVVKLYLFDFIAI